MNTSIELYFFSKKIFLNTSLKIKPRVSNKTQIHCFKFTLIYFILFIQYIYPGKSSRAQMLTNIARDKIKNKYTILKINSHIHPLNSFLRILIKLFNG